LLAMFGILMYVAFRYEFSFAVAAVVATAHDALFTLGIFVMAGGQFSGVMVAAVLTIIGYSINDKIVILDRIREDLKLGMRGSFGELINLALNQTLSRTLITGGAVILATGALYVFGGGVIHDFAFTFLVGIFTGTYSSIFIASYVVHRWNKGQRPHIGSGVSMETSASVRAPAAVRA
jgi:SecD/SecF fusion protein